MHLIHQSLIFKRLRSLALLGLEQWLACQKVILPSDIAWLSLIVGCCLPIFITEPPSFRALLLLSCASIAIHISVRKTFSLAFVFVSISLVHSMSAIERHQSSILSAALESQTIQLQGRVQGLPSVTAERTRFDFMVDNLEGVNGTPLSKLDSPINQSELLGERILLSCYRCRLDFRPGERWRLFVRVKRPNGYASWGAFDYERYLFGKQISAVGYIRLKEKNQRLGRSRNAIDRYRFALRNQVEDLHDVSKRGAGMLLALMIGDRSLLEVNQRRSLQATGVSHLIAISGLHIGLVFLGLTYLFRLLMRPFVAVYHVIPRQYLLLVPSLAGALFYAAMAGFAISTQRALLMLFLYSFLSLLGRKVSLIRLLLLTMTILLLLDPLSVLDVGFWLSCSAVAIIAWLSQLDNNKPMSLWRLQPWLWLGMVPITALFFGQVSLVSPLVNLVAVPVFCLVLIPMVFVNLLFYMVGATNLAVWLSTQLAYMFELISDGLIWLAAKPWASAFPEQVGVLGLVFLIISITVATYNWRYLFLPLLLGPILLWPTPPQISSGDYKVTLLDVGQGLAMVVQLQGYTLLYDTGPRYRTGFNTADAVVLPYLRFHGIDHIDHLVISHADSDHIGGLNTVLNSISVGRISTSRTDKIPSEFSSITRSCWAGQAWFVAGVGLQFVAPDRATPEGSNNRSCVLKLIGSGGTTLITGDIEKRVERDLIQRYPDQLKADFMLVPHQGSKTSSTSEWLEVVQPQLAMVAAGYRNHYGHPSPVVMARYEERGIDVFSTIGSGSIELMVTKNAWKITEFRVGHDAFWRR